MLLLLKKMLILALLIGPSIGYAERQCTRVPDSLPPNTVYAGEGMVQVSTVKNHVHHVLEKLQVRSRGEAAARYRRELGPSPGVGAGEQG